MKTDIINGKVYQREYEIIAIYCSSLKTYKTKKEAEQKARELLKELKKLDLDVELRTGEIYVHHENDKE